MSIKILSKIFGTTNDRILKKYYQSVTLINSLEKEISLLSDADFPKKTQELKAKVSKGESLNSILPYAFALVREASKRSIGLRHFDVQLIGGMALNDSGIAEMKTGEGKTLVATTAAYLNALTGKGVHIVTVNDYLVKRDFEWMGKLYNFLGLTTGCALDNMSPDEKRAAYGADITHVTNHTLGFDYLRDNTCIYRSQMVMRGFNFCIVDEVDSILVDEARTPLIISGPSNHDPKIYLSINKVINKLSTTDYEIDEKHKNVQLTETGNDKLNDLLKGIGILRSGEDLYSVEHISYVNYILQALKAHYIFKRDVDYIVKDGEVVIIDEFTGRIMDGRRYSDGLHQAIEAKEGVNVKAENQTLASITYQNLFRMYNKLSGMTGTAKTEASEFFDIYKLNVVEIPTHKKVVREDLDDLIFVNEDQKFAYIAKTVKEAQTKGQPVLIGTTSVDKSERLSLLLKKEHIPHNLLNAKHHEKEADIIADAGKVGAVTIATNMAGRGTDIKLGGNVQKKILHELSQYVDIDSNKEKEIIDNVFVKHAEEEKKVLDLGGLFIIGSERHESRRIDNQLRGRSGRQGDPGKSQFCLSLKDDLLRIFGGETIEKLLGTLGFKGDEPMQHGMLSRVIESSQKKVEDFHYNHRKEVLKYDDIANEQRKVIYEQRLLFVDTIDPRSIVFQIMSDVHEKFITDSTTDNNLNTDELTSLLHNLYTINKSDISAISNLGSVEELDRFFQQKYRERFMMHDQEIVQEMERRMLIFTLDECWIEHLYNLDHVKDGIHLRSFAQKDPLSEYKMESFNLFQSMMNRFTSDVLRKLFTIEINVK